MSIKTEWPSLLLLHQLFQQVSVNGIQYLDMVMLFYQQQWLLFHHFYQKESSFSVFTNDQGYQLIIS